MIFRDDREGKIYKWLAIAALLFALGYAFFGRG